MADINKLKDKIKSTIYPNGKGAINASDHQAMLLDMADGMAETDTKLATLSSEMSNYILNARLENPSTTISEEGYACTSYISVEPSSEVRINHGSVDKTLQILEYDAAMQYVDYWNIAVGTTYRNLKLNAKTQYVRFSFMMENLDKVSLMQGETILWSPFNMKESINSIRDDVGGYKNNAEYLRAYTDEDGVFLWGIKRDGSFEFAKGVPTPIRKVIEPLASQLQDIDGAVSYISNDEWLHAIIDTDKRIVFGIRNDGSIVNNSCYVKNKLSLGEAAMSELQKDLQKSGFNAATPVDWSNDTTIKLPIPRYCAKVNIISKTGLATTKVDDKKCILEYWDKSGNYFKKYIILNAQGSSSMAYIEKNQGIDVFNDEACEESCDITFGNWVAQDSFHLKCYYIDVFRGLANIGYNFCEEIIQHLNARSNRVMFDTQDITSDNSTGEFDTDFGDGALCHPDGFPFELYVNGEYYGLFAWNLKKHRKNYSMNKKDYTAALLDGHIGTNELFGGNIDWTAFELRNPKDLITMDGSKYDGENPQELIDSTSAKYDSSNSTHVNTAKTKALIIRQSKAVGLIAAETNVERARQLFEQYYDVIAMSCYFLGCNVTHHYDGFWKNWIWWLSGDIMSPTFYDMDSLFGRKYDGTKVEENSTTSILGTSLDLPTGQLVRLYKTELDSLYKEMRDNGIFSVANIMRYVDNWIERVGRDAYKKNIGKWPSIPSYRSEKNQGDGTPDGGFFDSRNRIKLWLEERFVFLDSYFNY